MCRSSAELRRPCAPKSRRFSAGERPSRSWKSLTQLWSKLCWLHQRTAGNKARLAPRLGWRLQPSSNHFQCMPVDPVAVHVWLQTQSDSCTWVALFSQPILQAKQVQYLKAYPGAEQTMWLYENHKHQSLCAHQTHIERAANSCCYAHLPLPVVTPRLLYFHPGPS